MRYALTAACILALPLFAEQNLDHEVSLLECKMNSVRDDTVYPCRSGARFASGRPFYCGYGLWVTGDVLLWTAFEGGSDYAYSSSSGVSTSEIGTVYKAKFDWNVGYRLGASYSWPQDNWDLGVIFTRVEPEAENSVSAPAGGRLGSLLTANDINTALDASLDWDTKLSVIDFEMGRSYFVSRYLYLRPLFGIRGAWVHQKADAEYSNTTTVEAVNNRNDFDGGGLRLGADTKWFFDTHWNLNLNASASALYGKFKVLNDRTTTTSGSTTYQTHMAQSFYRVVPTAQTSLGLGWETFFSNDGNHISLVASYELSYWWRQNQMFFTETASAAPYGERYSDDLGFHGFTLDMQISF